MPWNPSPGASSSSSAPFGKRRMAMLEADETGVEVISSRRAPGLGSARPYKRQRTIKEENAAFSAHFSAPTGSPRSSLTDPLLPTIVKEDLDDGQKRVIELILAGHNVVYIGPAGSGKSTITGAVLRELLNQKKRVRILAPTGIAALNVGGSTTFSFAGWSPSDLSLPIEKLLKKADGYWVRQRMRDTDVLIIDEISMVSSEFLDRFDLVMKRARGSPRPFGGVQLVFCGDFCQLGPVKPFEYCMDCGQEREVLVSKTKYECETHGIVEDKDKWAFKSKAYKAADFKHVLLQTVHRQSEEDFKSILFRLWLGKVLTTNERVMLSSDRGGCTNPTRLRSTIKEVLEINSSELRKLPGRVVTYTSIDEFARNPKHKHLQYKEQRSQFDHQLLALIEHRYEPVLKLKLGMPVLLLINMNVDEGLVNGSRGKIVRFQKHDAANLPKPRPSINLSSNNTNDRNERIVSNFVPSLGGDHVNLRYEQMKEFIDGAEQQDWPIVQFDNGKIVTIYAHCSVREMGDTEPLSLLMRTQIPLTAAWALTIHKSQGMTLNEVEVDVSKTFEPGQEYVAMSRASTLAGLRVKGLRRGYSCGGGNQEVHEWLWETFPQLRPALEAN